MLMLFLHKNIRTAFSFISGNKLLAMNDDRQYSPFTRKGPQITPLSSLSLRGAILPLSLRANPEPVEEERSSVSDFIRNENPRPEYFGPGQSRRKEFKCKNSITST